MIHSSSDNTLAWSVHGTRSSHHPFHGGVPLSHLPWGTQSICGFWKPCLLVIFFHPVVEKEGIVNHATEVHHAHSSALWECRICGSCALQQVSVSKQVELLHPIWILQSPPTLNSWSSLLLLNCCSGQGLHMHQNCHQSNLKVHPQYYEWLYKLCVGVLNFLTEALKAFNQGSYSTSASRLSSPVTQVSF